MTGEPKKTDLPAKAIAPPKRGRKPARSQSASDRVHFRAPPDDKAAWEAQARADGKTLSTWIVDVLNQHMQSPKGKE